MVTEEQFVLFFIETIRCDPSSKLFHPEGSYEDTTYFLCRINKNYPALSLHTPSYLEL